MKRTKIGVCSAILLCLVLAVCLIGCGVKQETLDAAVAQIKEEMEEQKGSLQAENAELRSDVEKLETEVAELTSDQTATEEELAKLTERMTQLISKISQMQDKDETLEEDIAELWQAVNQINALIASGS